MNPITLQPAFILHRRDYRDTSLIIELFTLHEGRISAIAKGAKRNKSSLRNSLHLFQPILISTQGKHELKTLTQAELQSPLANIDGTHLPWAFYLNELLFRLLEKHDPYPQLFNHYRVLLQRLAEQNIEEKHLRFFEYDLLLELGYGLQLTTDINNEPIDTAAYYHCLPHQAPVKTTLDNDANAIYSGLSLLALSTRQLDSGSALQDAKHLLRHALRQLLGDKPLKSRELLI